MDCVNGLVLAGLSALLSLRWIVEPWPTSIKLRLCPWFDTLNHLSVRLSALVCILSTHQLKFTQCNSLLIRYAPYKPRRWPWWVQLLGVDTFPALWVWLGLSNPRIDRGVPLIWSKLFPRFWMRSGRDRKSAGLRHDLGSFTGVLVSSIVGYAFV